MAKQKLFLMVLFLLLLGCGQKSTIKPTTQAKRLADAYGDGKYVVLQPVFPITDSALAYKTPIPGLGPIIGGVIRFVGDVFTATTTMGKLQMAYTQAIPEMPEMIKSVRLSRVFFYMKPPVIQPRIPKFDKWVLGRGDPTFDFLNKFAVRLNSVTLTNPDNYISTFNSQPYDKDASASIMKVFQKNYRPDVIDFQNASQIDLIRYSDKSKNKDEISEKYGKIHIFETTKPLETIRMLEKTFEVKEFAERILTIENSILLELKNDPIMGAKFEDFLEEIREDLKDKFDVTYIHTCDRDSCMEFNLPNANLVPILRKGNAIKLDGILHADKVPETFSLKGFVEFEVKIESPI